MDDNDKKQQTFAADKPPENVEAAWSKFVTNINGLTNDIIMWRAQIQANIAKPVVPDSCYKLPEARVPEKEFGVLFQALPINSPRNDVQMHSPAPNDVQMQSPAPNDVQMQSPAPIDVQMHSPQQSAANEAPKNV